MDRQQQRSLVNDLAAQISDAADEKTKQWFDNYLKGAIEYRGLKTPEVTKLLTRWRKQHQLADYPLECQLALCEQLISGRYAEDKFAGIIYLQKFLLKALEWQDVVEFCAGLFQKEYFFDWSTTDWLCVRVLDPLIVRNGLEAGGAIASWRAASNLWQQRASIVSFRHASVDPQFHPMIQTIIRDLVVDDRRFIQTGIGWVLADMSKAHPQLAKSLFREYLPLLSKEVIDRHTKHLASAKELKRLKRLATQTR